MFANEGFFVSFLKVSKNPPIKDWGDYPFFLIVLSALAEILIFFFVPSSSVILTVLKLGKNLLLVLL
jgi:hypothetical protein